MNRHQVQFPQLFLSLVKFVLPFCLWMFLFRDFISGRIPLNMDSTTIYSVTKFYFNNLLNGVVPLWDPFVFLGTPFYAITLCNLFNPVVQIVPVLKLLGVNYYHAFITYMVVYYFLGVFGFYCLAKVIFKDWKVAYIGYLMILFSGVGASLFNQLTILELFVPAVWFFVFLFRFADGYWRSDFLGLSFSAMILTISYLPFYFATLLLFFLTIGIFLFFYEFKRFVVGLLSFARRNIILFLLCVMGQVIAFAPLIVYKMIDSNQDVVSPSRHCNFAELTDCYERTLHEEGGMSHKETSQGGSLAERVHWRGLFTHLDKASYGIDQFFYLPVMVFMVILASAFVPWNKTQCFLAFLAVLLTLVGMGQAAFLHKFLYDHIFFFKYFRNLFFFETYIIPIIILFSVGQLKSLCDWEPATFFQRKAMLFWLVLGHAALFVFFAKQDGMILTTLLSVAGSCAVFVLGYLKLFNRRLVFLTGFLVLILIQPYEVFAHYSRNAQQFQCELPRDHVHPKFAWTRPTEEVKSDCKIFKFVHYESFYDSMAMKDARGYIGYPTSVTRGAFILSQWVDERVLLEFTSRKFWLYDHVRLFGEQALEVRSLGGIIQGQYNAAYIAADNEGTPATFTPEDWEEDAGKAAVLDDTQASIEHFDVNNLHMTVDAPAQKFLVYTDSFTKHWKVFVNGQAQKLIRANAAFKGVWVPAGKSEIEFRYEPPGGGWIYMLVTASLMVFMIMTLFGIYRENNWPWRERSP